jgi:hypothetical protein
MTFGLQPASLTLRLPARAAWLAVAFESGLTGAAQYARADGDLGQRRQFLTVLEMDEAQAATPRLS